MTCVSSLPSMFYLWIQTILAYINNIHVEKAVLKRVG